MALKELISNDDGRLSTTATIQLFGFLTALCVLLFAVYRESPDLPNLFSTFFYGCMGTAATKGIANAIRGRERPPIATREPLVGGE